MYRRGVPRKSRHERLGTFANSLGVGFAVGAVLAAGVLASVPGRGLPHVAPIVKNEGGEIVESFFLESPRDGIAVTHSGKMPLGVFPPGAQRFSEPAIERGFALFAKVRNANGEVIGVAAELEVHPESGNILTDDIVWQTEWTVVIPGRGVLFLHQEEHSGELGPKVLKPVLETGKPWEGDWTVQTTSGPGPGGRGLVVGGSGEFAGASGSFVEIDRVTKLTTDGVLEGTFELRVSREPGR